MRTLQLTCTLCCETKIKLIKDRKLLLLFPQFINYKTFELLWNLDITFLVQKKSATFTILVLKQSVNLPRLCSEGVCSHNKCFLCSTFCNFQI